VTYGKLGSAYGKSNETVEAREALASGRAIMVKLLDQHQDSAQLKQDLAGFDVEIAKLGEDPPKEMPKP
jgi:hypothetical protein